VVVANDRAAALPPHWFQILLSIADEPKHGLAITDDVYERTGGRLRLWPGVLYTALKKMTDAGLVAETEIPRRAAVLGGKPRYFGITPAGRRACAEEAAYLARVLASARAKRLLKAK
jgi:DNA-binding PadR family transcriptional regulator